MSDDNRSLIDDEDDEGQQSDRNNNRRGNRGDEEDESENGLDEEEDEDDERTDRNAVIHPKKDPQFNTYELVKEQFETICCKIESPKVLYLKFAEGCDEPDALSPEQLTNLHANLYYYDSDEIRHKFIKAWIEDVDIRTYVRIVVDPRMSTPPNVFNLWRGFLAEKLPPVNPAAINDIMQPIIRHLDDVITLGNAEHTGYILDYLANIIQRPYQKTQVAISLFGPQGAGKGIIFDFFRKCVLGESCSFQTASADNDLLSNFSNGFVNKVFIQVPHKVVGVYVMFLLCFNSIFSHRFFTYYLSVFGLF